MNPPADTLDRVHDVADFLARARASSARDTRAGRRVGQDPRDCALTRGPEGPPGAGRSSHSTNGEKASQARGGGPRADLGCRLGAWRRRLYDTTPTSSRWWSRTSSWSTSSWTSLAGPSLDSRAGERNWAFEPEPGTDQQFWLLLDAQASAAPSLTLVLPIAQGDLEFDVLAVLPRG